MAANRRDVEEARRSAPAKRKRRSDPPNKAAQWGGVVTSLIKLGGLILAGNEALFQPAPHDAVVFGLAAFMMAGAQGIDSLLASIFSAGRTDDE
jgi:hypothetical protein